MLDELLFSKLRCGLCFFFVLLFCFNAQETGTGWSVTSPLLPRLTYSPLVSCLFHSLPMRVLLTVANNNTLPFCALDAVAILPPSSTFICCFWACFSVCSFVCFVFSVSCCFVLMLCFLTFRLSAALLISCRLFYRDLLPHSQNYIYIYLPL